MVAFPSRATSRRNVGLVGASETSARGRRLVCSSISDMIGLGSEGWIDRVVFVQLNPVEESGREKQCENRWLMRVCVERIEPPIEDSSLSKIFAGEISEECYHSSSRVF
jgi:hypothetical protein